MALQAAATQDAGLHRKRDEVGDTLYPLFCDLSGKRVVIIGAGQVAARKAASLASFGCKPCVIAPWACPAIEGLAQRGEIDLALREYRRGDLAGAFLVFSATGNETIDDAVLAEAHDEGALVNTVDDPKRCDFYVPSMVSRGKLQIAVSTSGASPMLARRCRKELEQAYPEAYGPYTDLLGSVRDLVKQRVPGPEEKRKPLLAALLDSNLYERVASGEAIDPEDAYAEVIAPMRGENEETASYAGGQQEGGSNR